MYNPLPSPPASVLDGVLHRLMPSRRCCSTRPRIMAISITMATRSGPTMSPTGELAI
jgi:hypothetical protein